MKPLMKISVLALVIAAFAFIPPKHNVVGNWRITYSDGTTEHVDFKSDGTFKSYGETGKTTHNGIYKFSGDTMSINDKEGCGDTYWATYKITFFGKDSASNTAIEDSCSGRREAINGAGLKRIKN
ncbi:MAG: hypothetical protein ABI358_09940 [Ginsengibacter sp.]